MYSVSDMHDFSPESPAKRAFTFPHFLKRRPRRSRLVHHPPPLPPPKDDMHIVDPKPRSTSLSLEEAFNAIQRPSISSSQDKVVIAPAIPPKPSVSLPPLPMTAEQRAEYRKKAQRRRQREEREIEREEQIRQARTAFLKAQTEREAQEAEERQQAQLAHDLEVAKRERERRVAAQLAEEEAARKQLEERKLEAKRRRIEEGRRMQEWRDEQERRRLALQQKKEEDLKKYEAEWIDKVRTMGDRVNEKTAREGWVTMQTSLTAPWRRRWYKFVGDTVFFYRSPQDKHKSLDTLHMSRYAPLALRHSRNAGYDELGAIEHSFALEFDPKTVGASDSRCWSFFADTEAEKDHLLGLFYYFGNINTSGTMAAFLSKIPRRKKDLQ